MQSVGKKGGGGGGGGWGGLQTYLLELIGELFHKVDIFTVLLSLFYRGMCWRGC